MRSGPAQITIMLESLPTAAKHVLAQLVRLASLNPKLRLRFDLEQLGQP